MQENVGTIPESSTDRNNMEHEQYEYMISINGALYPLDGASLLRVPQDLTAEELQAYTRDRARVTVSVMRVDVGRIVLDVG